MRIKSEQKTGPDWSRPKFTGKMPGRLYLGLKCPKILIHLQVTLLYFMSLKGLNIFAQIVEKSHSHFGIFGINHLGEY